MATRTTKKTTTPTPTKKNPTTVTYNSKGEKYVTNTNSAGTKTAVSVTKAGIKTVKVVNSKGKEFIKVYDKSGREIKATNNTKPVPAKITKPVPASNTKTTVVTPKAKAVAPAPVKVKTNTMPVRNTTAKDYEIYDRANLDRSGSLYHGTGWYGTKAQQDSSINSISKYNTGVKLGSHKITKSSYFPGDEGIAKYAKQSRLTYVPPKNTNSGPLRNRPQTKASMEELAKRWQ